MEPEPRSIESESLGRRRQSVSSSAGGPESLQRSVSVSVQACKRCGRSHRGECWGNARVCFQCGSPDSLVSDCLEVVTSPQGQAQRTVFQAQRGRGFSRGGASHASGGTF